MLVFRSVETAKALLLLLTERGKLEILRGTDVGTIAERLVEGEVTKFDELADWLVADHAVVEVFASTSDLVQAVGRVAAGLLPADLASIAKARLTFAAMVDAASTLFSWYADRVAQNAPRPDRGECLVILGASPVLYGYDARDGLNVLEDENDVLDHVAVDLDPLSFAMSGESAVDPGDREIVEVLLFAMRLAPVAARLRPPLEVRYYCAEARSVAAPFARLTVTGPLPDAATLVRDLRRAMLRVGTSSAK